MTVCAPLCAASRAYGRFDKPWLHEIECPVRIAWEAERAARLHPAPIPQEPPAGTRNAPQSAPLREPEIPANPGDPR